MNWFLKKMIIATTSIITLSVGSLTAHAQQLCHFQSLLLHCIEDEIPEVKYDGDTRLVFAKVEDVRLSPQDNVWGLLRRNYATALTSNYGEN